MSTRPGSDRVPAAHELALDWGRLELAPSRRSLRRGEHLFRRGDPAERVFRLRRGAIRLERVAADGTPVTLFVARAPETLAEPALFSATYHCDAVAETAAEVEQVETARLLQALGAEHDTALRWIRRLSHQVQELRALLELRSIRSADGRLLRFLELFGPVDAREITLATLAQQLGLRPETLYRSLGRLERRGELRRERGFLERLA